MSNEPYTLSENKGLGHVQVHAGSFDMPIYEYQCGKCGEVFEVLQKLSDPPPQKHSCGSRKVSRVMSRSAFVLKGEGWYITDYARKEQKSKDKSKKSDDGSSSSTPSSDKKDSKKPKAKVDAA